MPLGTPDLFVALAQVLRPRSARLEADVVVDDGRHLALLHLLAVHHAVLGAAAARRRTLLPLADVPAGWTRLRVARAVVGRLQKRVAEEVGDHFEVVGLRAVDSPRLKTGAAGSGTLGEVSVDPRVGVGLGGAGSQRNGVLVQNSRIGLLVE